VSATVAAYASGVTIEAIHQCLGSHKEPRHKERRETMRLTIVTPIYDTDRLNVPGNSFGTEVIIDFLRHLEA